MKIKKAACIGTALAALLQVYGTASAAELTVSASYSAQTSRLTVTGTADNNVTLLILPEGTSPADTDDNSAKVYFDITAPTGAGYGFYNIGLGEDTPTGYYTAYVTAADKSSASARFYFVNTKDTASVLELVNAAKSADALKGICEEHKDIFGIDTADAGYIAARDEAYRIYLLIKSEYTSENSGAMYDEFHAALAMAQMEKAPQANVEALLSAWAANLGIDYAGDYNDARLTESVRAELASLLASGRYSDEVVRDGRVVPFATLLREKKVLAAVRKSDSWQRLKQILMSDFKDECAAFTDNADFKGLKNQDAVFVAMASGTYASYADIAAGFEAAVANRKKAESGSSGESPAGGGSGGGSSSSGGSSGISYNNPTGQTGGAAAEFSDLPASHWAYTQVMRLCTGAVISGYPDNTFKPDSYVTRAEFAKMLLAAIGAPAEGDAEFSDVPQDAWFAKYVAAAAARGIASGYPDGSFAPNGCITRQDAALMLERSIENAGRTLSDGEYAFADGEEIAEYARGAVRRLFAAGIVKGDENACFNPAGKTKRSEAASMIYNAFYR